MENQHPPISESDITNKKQTESSNDDASYKNLFQNAPDPIFVEDFEGNILDINDAACKLHGMSRDELLSMNVIDLVPPDQRESTKAHFKEITEGKLTYFEGYSYTRTGDETPVDIKARRIIYNEKPAILLIVRDISEKKKIEQELKTTMNQYQLLFHLSPSGIIIEDLDGVILDANESIATSTGYSREELIGKKIHMLTEPSMYHIVDHNLARIINGATLMHEVTSLRNDKSYFYTQLIETLIHLKDGKKVILSISHDITQRKLIEFELQNKQRLLEGVIASILALVTAPEINNAIEESFELIGKTLNVSRVYIFENSKDPKTGTLLMSQKFEWTDGLVTPQINNPFLQNLPYEASCPRWQHELGSKRVIHGLVKDFPVEEKVALEEQNILSILVIPVFIENRFWGFIGIDECKTLRQWSETEISILNIAGTLFGNILVKNEAAETLKKAKEQAEESLKLKTALLSNMSHEFRTPLSGILGFADIIQSEAVNPDLSNMAGFIISSGQRLLKTLDNIMLLSELESGVTKVKPELTEISSLVESTALIYQPFINEKGLEMEVFSESKCYCIVDPKLFSNAIGQVIDNAIKFTRKGLISIKTGITKDENGEKILIQIKDTGIGIAKEFENRIFEDFRQISEGNNRAFEGSGLGLALSRKIILLFGGKITLESIEKEGSSFSIILMLAENVPDPNAISGG